MSDQSLPFDRGAPRASASQSSSWERTTDHPHSYPLLVHDHGLFTSWTLLMRTLPYVMARMAVISVASVACLIWMVVTFGGAAWIGSHISTVFGFVWLLPWLVAGGWVWGTILRYSLHLIACGHVAVITHLITQGTTGEGNESQFAYGRRVVVSRFGQVTVLYGFSALVKGALETFHRTLDGFGEFLSIPGFSSITQILDTIAKAATRYLDKVILSYTLARNDNDPWHCAQDGLVYYCQDVKPILKTSIWIVIVEKLTSLVAVHRGFRGGGDHRAGDAGVRERDGRRGFALDRLPDHRRDPVGLYQAAVPDLDDHQVSHLDRKSADQCAVVALSRSALPGFPQGQAVVSAAFSSSSNLS